MDGMSIYGQSNYDTWSSQLVSSELYRIKMFKGHMQLLGRRLLSFRAASDTCIKEELTVFWGGHIFGSLRRVKNKLFTAEICENV